MSTLCARYEEKLLPTGGGFSFVLKCVIIDMLT